jgi:hypothetical protein
MERRNGEGDALAAAGHADETFAQGLARFVPPAIGASGSFYSTAGRSKKDGDFDAHLATGRQRRQNRRPRSRAKDFMSAERALWRFARFGVARSCAQCDIMTIISARSRCGGGTLYSKRRRRISSNICGMSVLDIDGRPHHNRMSLKAVNRT